MACWGPRRRLRAAGVAAHKAELVPSEQERIAGVRCVCVNASCISCLSAIKEDEAFADMLHRMRVQGACAAGGGVQAVGLAVPVARAYFNRNAAPWISKSQIQRSESKTLPCVKRMVLNEPCMRQ